MPRQQQLGRVVRQNYGKIDDVLEMPDLVEIQRKSYQWFLDEGLHEVLHDVSPINDFSGNLSIEFIDFTLDPKTKYSVEESKDRDVNYAAPLRVLVRLFNKETGEVSEKEIYMVDFPVMTPNGTFVINGAERVIISQISRSPGVNCMSNLDKNGFKVYHTQVIPYRGAWLEYETDTANCLFVRIDKNRKIHISVLLRALGVESDADIAAMFNNDPFIMSTTEKDGMNALAAETRRTPGEESLKEIYKKLRPGEPALVESATALVNGMFFDNRRYDLAFVGRYKYNKKLDLICRAAGSTLARDAISAATGEVVFPAGHRMSLSDAKQLAVAGVTEVYLRTDAGLEVKAFNNNTIFPESMLGYDLSEAGIKGKVSLSVLREIVDECGGNREEIIAAAKRDKALLAPKHVTKEDIFASINYTVCLMHGFGSEDDIDHLGNRRLKCVGELLQNQMRIGFTRMDKIIRERMTIHDTENITPEALINIRPVVSAIREFFGSSPLSQFMDQHNPLAELTHKRRLSALGPGGLSRERASFEVRDVHYTHFGRMCPIETPEGPNIGLISYLAAFARVNEYGFIETPYRKVVDGVVTDEIVYLAADTEDEYVIAQAVEPLTNDKRFVNRRIIARNRSEIIQVDSTAIDFMDVSTKASVSIAPSMIPFLENNENARDLMGANMQKQAVPLLVTESPIVGTGMEHKAAMDSGAIVKADADGTIAAVCSEAIKLAADDGTTYHYPLIKFKRSNQGMCINQRPLVHPGERVKKGEIIADGAATDNGEIALGKNVLVGFMPWEGYNYEDAVLLNERLVRDDVYTSIHIEEYIHEARDTKLGPEEITRELPNVSEDMIKDLSADGIIRKGTEVRAGDILVGKVTPKGETELTAEERLLRAIFGEKAREVRDTSLRLPHGESGVVVDVKVFGRDTGDDLSPGSNKVVHVYIAQKRKISVGDKMAGRHGNKGVVSRILPSEDMPFLADGTPLDIVLSPLGVPSRMNIGQVIEVHLGLAAQKLGVKIMSPVFDGASEQDIFEALEQANLPTDGKSWLYDGRTGERFDNPVTVGIMYYLKLAHLVDDKIHARSTGPYSLVTQQPLGGKAQFGGQRFGEMEVWALEAYGAAHTLQEILTVKSDDVTGRVKTYEAIIKGQNIPTPGVPESFKVLIKELQSLALDVRVLDEAGNEVELNQLVDDFLEPGRYVDPENPDANLYADERFRMAINEDKIDFNNPGSDDIDDDMEVDEFADSDEIEEDNASEDFFDEPEEEAELEFPEDEIEPDFI